MTSGSTTWNFTYNADGLRTQKTNGTTTYNYTYNGSSLSQMTVGDDTLRFFYDASGLPVSVTYNGTTYYYSTNTLGDVIAMLDTAGTAVVSYIYDAWGTLSTVRGELATTLGMINPLRYRGYVYDQETGLYFLQSRYFNPIIGRFINSDNQLSTGNDLTGLNLFAYCGNNPANRVDPTGEAWWNYVWGALNVVSGFLQGAAGAALGATVGWTGIGAVVAGFLVVNGAATASQGVGQIVNEIAQTKVLPEDNIVRTGVEEIGRVVGGETGANIAGAVYDTAVFAANIYAGKVTSTPSACFAAGTVILTETGSKAIEKVVPGELVWAQDTETGEKSLKKVRQTFVRESNELVYVYIEGETITTTPEHPFYVYEQGWIEAIQLQVGDLLVLQNGEFAAVDKILYELLNIPIKVYNFEVEDFHTYHVGNCGILVHNDCQPKSPQKLSGGQLKNVDVHQFKEDISNGGSRLDLFVDKANNGAVWLGNKNQNIWINTGYTLDEIIELYPKNGG